MATFATLLIVLSALGAGLMGGFFYAFSNLVMPALARRPAADAAETMRTINVVVLNMTFLAILFGTAVAGAAAAVVAVSALPDRQAWAAVAAAIVYLAGSIGVTIARNVPLNQELAASPAGAEREAAQRRYLDAWTRWNHVRTTACVAAAAGLYWRSSELS